MYFLEEMKRRRRRRRRRRKGKRTITCSSIRVDKANVIYRNAYGQPSTSTPHVLIPTNFRQLVSLSRRTFISFQLSNPDSRISARRRRRRRRSRRRLFVFSLCFLRVFPSAATIQGRRLWDACLPAPSTVNNRQRDNGECSATGRFLGIRGGFRGRGSANRPIGTVTALPMIHSTCGFS